MAEGFGKYEVYAVADSIYCYRGSNVLRNKFSIRDSEQLKKIETDISAIRQTDLLTNPIKGRYSPNHLCKIHHYLLGDIYSFAGHFRREDIAKNETRFLYHGQIRKELMKLLKQLREEKILSGLRFEEFVERSAFYFSELNYIHPFREGNGRATREFMRQIFSINGYEVDWGHGSIVSLQNAMIESVYDTRPLSEFLHVALSKNGN